MSDITSALAANGQMVFFPPATITATNTDVGIAIGFYKPGSNGKVVVTNSAHAFTFTIDDVADTGIGTAGVVTLTSLQTVGTNLVDVINATTYWRARPVGMLRADRAYDAFLGAPTTYIIPTGTEAAILRNTSQTIDGTNFSIGVKFGLRDCAGRTSTGSTILPVMFAGKLTCSSGLNLELYSTNDIAKTERLIYTSATAIPSGPTTETVVNDTTWGFRTAFPGDDLLVRIKNAVPGNTISDPAFTFTAARIVDQGMQTGHFVSDI